MRDILLDIHQYSQQFSISQVVTFFERKGISISKSMIQNYVRDGLLPPPLNKRYYSHKHLAALALIDKLKLVYDMAIIKLVLLPLMDEDGLPLELYRKIIMESEKLSRQDDLDSLLLMVYSADLKSEALRRFTQ